MQKNVIASLQKANESFPYIIIISSGGDNSIYNNHEDKWEHFQITQAKHLLHSEAIFSPESSSVIPRVMYSMETPHVRIHMFLMTNNLIYAFNAVIHTLWRLCSGNRTFFQGDSTVGVNQEEGGRPRWCVQRRIVTGSSCHTIGGVTPGVGRYRPRGVTGGMHLYTSPRRPPGSHHYDIAPPIYDLL